MESLHNIMWKITMTLLFHVTFICRYRRKWCEGQISEVAEEIYRLRELRQDVLVENIEREGKRQRIDEMVGFLHEQSYELEEYDEPLVRRLIEKVMVYGDKIQVGFKSGVKVDIDM